MMKRFMQVCIFLSSPVWFPLACLITVVVVVWKMSGKMAEE